MKIYFDIDRERLLNIKEVNYDTGRMPYDAVIVLLKDLKYEMIDNLCNELVNYYNSNDSKYYYNKIQNDNADESFRKAVLECAYNLIHNNICLGTEMVNGHNTSSWLGHCLLEGEVCSRFAMELGLNPDIAKKMGILHDIGRKITHSFGHVWEGYKYLMKQGWVEEAICCLSHSFINNPDISEYANRCASCEPSIDGFKVDSNGNPYYEDEKELDDMGLFLKSYLPNMYDKLLNLGDLMATSDSVLSPLDRIEDISTRKKPDERSRKYFLVSLNNFLNYLLNKLVGSEIDYLKLTPDLSDEELNVKLKEKSDAIYEEYLCLEKQRSI